MGTSTSHPNETNGLLDPRAYHDAVTRRISRHVPWSVAGLRVTRLRLLSELGFPAWDVSYCHGDIDGEPVEVTLPFDQLPRRGLRTAIVEAATREGVNAQRLGVFEALSLLR